MWVYVFVVVSLFCVRGEFFVWDLVWWVVCVVWKIYALLESHLFHLNYISNFVVGKFCKVVSNWCYPHVCPLSVNKKVKDLLAPCLWHLLFYSFHTYFHTLPHFLPPENEVWGKVIFSQAYINPSVHKGWGVPMGGGLHPGGLHTGGLHPEEGSTSIGGVCIKGFCTPGEGQTPPSDTMRYSLLECILVLL